MFDITESTIEWEGRPLHIKTGEVGRQASVVCVSYGGTVVLAAVTVQRNDEIDGKPSDPSGLALITNFVSKGYATGKIPAGFFKREGKLSEREILASRIIDRAVRPLIVKNLVNEVNIVCKLLAYNGKALPEVPALIAASAALYIAGVPCECPVVGVNISLDQNNNVSYNNCDDDASILDLFVACTESSIVMVESDAKEVPEERMMGAFQIALDSAKPVIEFLKSFFASIKSVGKTKYVLYNNDVLHNKMIEKFENELSEVYNAGILCKKERHEKLRNVYNKIFAAFTEDSYSSDEIKFHLKEIERNITRKKLIEEGIRIDGRKPTTIRDIDIKVDYLPGTHGSALFTRGGTQSLVVTTLGSYQDEQVVDDMDGDRRESVFLHYNFLPYAVGEVGALRAPGRREIGHGRLALKAIQGVLPSKKDFSYTIRIVSEITESDGSSSMATVCGASLALMDTGAPIKKHVAGVAMGLVKEGDQYVVLTDISGDEDSLGDMDFKVAGTEDGITALQMDIKIDGVSIDVIRDALSHALKGRLHVLAKMNEAMGQPRPSVKESAPKILSYEIPKDFVHKVIGSGGKTIKAISDENSSKIDIDANNVVHIVSDTYEDLMSVKAKIDAITSGNGASLPKVGEVYKGKVVSVVHFGLFVSLTTGQEGLVHISEIQRERVNDIHALYKQGDPVDVRVKEISKDDGKIKLTMRLSEDRMNIPSTPRPPRRDFDMNFDPRSNVPRGDRGERRDSRGSGRSRNDRDDRSDMTSGPKRKKFF